MGLTKGVRFFIIYGIFSSLEHIIEIQADTLPTPTECGKVDLSTRIFGGVQTHVDEFPWSTMLIYENKVNGDVGFACGGALINHYHILTAAHCTQSEIMAKQNLVLSKVRLGEWNTESEIDCEMYENDDVLCSPGFRDYAIQEKIVHPQYDNRTQANDIALLRLAQEVEYTNFISPICLPLQADAVQKLYENVAAEVAGWGQTETALYSKVKLKTTVTVKNLEQCKNHNMPQRVKNRIGGNQLCAMGIGTDACHGDSGGPLMLQDMQNGKNAYYVIGVISFGFDKKTCAVDGYASIYTRLGPYIGWIKEQTQK
ncbi:spaetzle-processing enzyme [Zeugodacus cucurbitae]|nr:spaetzle-processing enzyme [Zeugodacus cucurbitae]